MAHEKISLEHIPKSLILKLSFGCMFRYKTFGACILSMQDKTSGDWNVYYGLNSSPKKVGYFPKSLLPAMIDKPVQLRLGGYVSHEKPTPSPPMGNGNAPSSGSAASVSSIKLIDADGNDLMGNTNLRYYESRPDCYSLSRIDSGRFFYGGPGCTD
jgi:hypothetical protein